MVLFSTLREYFFFWIYFFRLILWPSSMCFYCFRPVVGLLSLFVLSILGFPWGLPFCQQHARDRCAPDGWHQDVCPRDKRLRQTYPRRMAQTVMQTDGPGTKSLDGRVLQFHGFASEGHPSVPFVLALTVSETDDAETEEGHPRRRFPRRRKAKTDVAEMDVPETEGAIFKVSCQVLVNVTNSFFFSFR